MASKNSPKQPLEQIHTPPEVIAPGPIASDFDLEDVIADELLSSVDWSRVRSSLISKAKQKFISMLFNSNDRPVVISPFPELQALPSRDDDEVAA